MTVTVTQVTPQWRRFVDMDQDDIDVMLNTNNLSDSFVSYNSQEPNLPFSVFIPWVDEEDQLRFMGLNGSPESEDTWWTAIKFTNKPVVE